MPYSAGSHRTRSGSSSRYLKEAGKDGGHDRGRCQRCAGTSRMRTAVSRWHPEAKPRPRHPSSYLLESDFSCMPQVVLEGRRVVNNIQRSASLFLVKNIFSRSCCRWYLCCIYDHLSAGTVADITDQHVYDRSAGVLPGAGAEQEHHQGAFPDKRIPESPARGADRCAGSGGAGRIRADIWREFSRHIHSRNDAAGHRRVYDPVHDQRADERHCAVRS